MTHDPEEAMRIADRIVLMRDGRIVQVGDARTLYRHPVDLQAARFFCEINELQSVVRAGRVATPLGSFAAEALPEGSPAAICIRPQGIGFARTGGGIPARILQRRFIGAVDMFELAVDGLDAPVLARIRNAPACGKGQDVEIAVDPDEVLVFAATPA